MQTHGLRNAQQRIEKERKFVERILFRDSVAKIHSTSLSSAETGSIRHRFPGFRHFFLKRIKVDGVVPPDSQQSIGVSR